MDKFSMPDLDFFVGYGLLGCSPCELWAL